MTFEVIDAATWRAEYSFQRAGGRRGQLEGDI